jgi:acetate kinase
MTERESGDSREPISRDPDAVLVVNAGSTSLKLHLVDRNERARPVVELTKVPADGLLGVAHRVVHGGPHLRRPILLDEEVLAEIRSVEPLAPLHNSPALEAIAEARRLFRRVPQVAVFDTAFHATLPPESAAYAIPGRWREEWAIRRYGFHGLSVAWSAERAPQLLGRTLERLVICHLGGGSSVTALRDGRSVDTSMGFSPLEGIPMATRSGSLDPGALLYLLRERDFDADSLERALNHESGLKALGGREGDMRALERAAADGDQNARLALAVFVHRLAGAVAAMAAASGGLEALIFTAGVGENSAWVREQVCLRLAFLGVEMDARLNQAAVPDVDIAADRSPVRVLVIAAREELVAARAARAVLTL